ncbi:MAG: hypothetical protein R6V12_03335 [Candidatus Hydrogenedentota bacterium]
MRNVTPQLPQTTSVPQALSDTWNVCPHSHVTSNFPMGLIIHGSSADYSMQQISRLFDKVDRVDMMDE